MRNTIQREIILEFLQENKVHPTAQEIYQKVKKDVPQISRATVYQNLHKLTKENLVKEVAIGSVSRFEANRGSHHHLHCKSCNEIIDIPNKLTASTQSSIKKLAKNNKIAEFSILFEGFCNNCKQGGN